MSDASVTGIKVLSMIFFAAALFGCAGSKSYADTWAMYGDLRMVEPDNASYDYKFYVRAARDFEINTQNKGDRMLLIRGYLKETCKDVEVVDEQFLPAGGTAIGGLERGTYVVKIKCIK